MKTLTVTAIAVLLLLSISGSAQNTSKADQKILSFIFPKGELGPTENFTGKAWNIGLVENDPSGQILIITDGTGYHQIKGQPRQTLKKGDIVKCPPNVKHWHGASPDVGMLQQYILPKTEKGIVTWLQKVTDEEYLGSK